MIKRFLYLINLKYKEKTTQLKSILFILFFNKKINFIEISYKTKYKSIYKITKNLKTNYVLNFILFDNQKNLKIKSVSSHTNLNIKKNKFFTNYEKNLNFKFVYLDNEKKKKYFYKNKFYFNLLNTYLILKSKKDLKIKKFDIYFSKKKKLKSLFIKNFFHSPSFFINFFKFNLTNEIDKFDINDLLISTEKNYFFPEKNIKIYKIIQLTTLKNNTKMFNFLFYTVILTFFIDYAQKVNFNVSTIFFKNNLNHFLKYLLFINDKNIFSDIKIDYKFFSNNFLKNYFNFFDYNAYEFYYNRNFKNKITFNNYYPILISNKKTQKKYFSIFKNNYDIDYILFTNKFVISFLEKNFKKNIYVRYVNNYYNPTNNYYLDSIIFDFKNFQPAFWKNFLVKDFIIVLWYSFFLKDLTMISNWISIFMETMHFKNHKKFLSFFFNFMNKYSDVFTNSLKIKGFFFDIRGKVGVTGSSKKRHLSFRFGSINKSSKRTKINFNQNLVRTYSGVLGLTYIINY